METFTDPRDGNQYKVVKINNLLWFAENLRYQGVLHCFPDKNSDNVQKYGYLYTWENAKTACPEGWRLPTKEEFLTLIGAIEHNAIEHNEYKDSSSIRDLSWLSGSNTSRFSALPAGFRAGKDRFYYFGFLTYIWSVTPYDSSRAHNLFVGPDYTSMSINYVKYAFSVRCVKSI